MTQQNSQSPVPPEMNAPQQYVYTPLRPDEGEALPEKSKPGTDEPASEGNGCQRGCLFGLTGAVGCLFLIVALLAGALVVTGQTIGGFLNGFGSLFSGGGSPGQIDTGRIYIPRIEKIQQLSKLTTVRYNYAYIVTAQTDMPALLQTLYGESLVMVAVGHIEAGIDLRLMTEDSLVYDEATRTLTITLPAPALLECFLNEAQSYVVERNSGVFAPTSPVLDDDSRRFALQQFRAKALEEGILNEAQVEAEIILREFISLFNDANALPIQFTTTPPNPDAPLPPTCQ